MARIVVIGAGLGGLAAAARLTPLGHEVTVYERSVSIGGKLGTYTRDGFRFDTGPSLLTLPQSSKSSSPPPATRWTARSSSNASIRTAITGSRRHRTRRPRGRAASLPRSDPALGATAARQWERLLDPGPPDVGGVAPARSWRHPAPRACSPSPAAARAAAGHRPGAHAAVARPPPR